MTDEILAMLCADDVHDLFEAVLQRKADALQRIEAGPENARIEEGKFVFTIAALLAILDPEGSTDLKTFHKLLYSSELNRELRARGAEITVYHSTGKIESNFYCLKAT